MRKRMLAMLLACCLIGGTLSGCGGKTENSTESSQASAETAKTEQEDTSGEKEQPENITIEFFNQKQEEAAQQAYRNAAEDFHKEYPYITIEINTVPDSDKVLTARMAADDVPVVFHGKPTSQAFFESAEAGFCLDLSDQPFIQNAIPSILNQRMVRFMQCPIARISWVCFIMLIFLRNIIWISPRHGTNLWLYVKSWRMREFSH